MPFTPARDYFAAIEKRPVAHEHSVKCARCQTVLQESITGSRRLGDDSHVCSDCYFEGLGSALEEYPFAARNTHRAG
jgi:hypothetical protein